MKEFASGGKNNTARKVPKYGVFSGPYFPVFGQEKTPYLDTFQVVYVSKYTDKYASGINLRTVAANIYLFKVNNRNTRKRRRLISHLLLIFLLLNLNK